MLIEITFVSKILMKQPHQPFEKQDAIVVKCYDDYGNVERRTYRLYLQQPFQSQYITFQYGYKIINSLLPSSSIYLYLECATTIIPDSYAAIKIVVLIHLVFPEHTSCCEDTIIDLMLSISKSVLQQVYVVLWLYSPRKASVSYRKCIPFLQQYLR